MLIDGMGTWPVFSSFSIFNFFAPLSPPSLPPSDAHKTECMEQVSSQPHCTPFNSRWLSLAFLISNNKILRISPCYEINCLRKNGVICSCPFIKKMFFFAFRYHMASFSLKLLFLVSALLLLGVASAQGRSVCVCLFVTVFSFPELQFLFKLRHQSFQPLTKQNESPGDENGDSDISL